MVIHLPGIDGAALTQRLKASSYLARIPIDMMTGHACKAALLGPMEAGVATPARTGSGQPCATPRATPSAIGRRKRPARPIVCAAARTWPLTEANMATVVAAPGQGRSALAAAS